MIDKRLRYAWAYGWLKGTAQLDRGYAATKVADELRAALARCIEVIENGNEEPAADDDRAEFAPDPEQVNA